ncbi:cytochrome d ubiquinol oxidase subunit II [Anatilimnocola sp. NA78]|uniref:cytochrome d ubiquinol oxidase subunit II n=1 Tax=Anatilimnocola sp. NA78 TaxID=3415683 RepID=UPI003CE580FE
MIDTELLVNLSAAAALVGMMAYGIFGGADFGGGVWDLLATGPRQKEQRLAIQKAMGPVWEANHVWLIFVVIVLFTCFPRAYSRLAIALFVPFHLALVGIMLRGASFVFRSYQSRSKDAAAETSVWGIVFGVASIISPVLLGAAFGVVTEGLIRVQDGEVVLSDPLFWLTPYALLNGLLALATCAYLAAVYLTNETKGDLREDFRLRAIFAGTATAVLAGGVMLLAWYEARWFFERLLSPRSLPVVLAGLACFAASAWAVFTRRYILSRVFAASEICLLILGWGLAQHPYLVYPDLTFAASAAPAPTLQFLVLTLPVGAALLAPSLFYLFRVFKS